jgi:hypothetical protein
MNRTKMQSSAKPISSSLSRVLNAYTLAAGAAGVSLLAVARSANAEVVYTPVHVSLDGTGESGYRLDVNHDGVQDFGFTLINSSIGGELQVGAEGLGNGVLFNGVAPGPAALKPGAAIGPAKSFYGCVGSCGYIFMATIFPGGSEGNWLNVTNRYLGLKFYVGKDVYYGWVRMSVRAKGIAISTLVTGYAYETIPNHAIRAGQTSGTFEHPEFEHPGYGEASLTPESPAAQPDQSASLGVLAMGAPGVTLWRREATTVAAQ